LTKLSYLKILKTGHLTPIIVKWRRQTGVPKSTTARVTQQQEKLRDEWILRHGQQGTSQKRKREGKDLDVEGALNQ
jgi:hypothetical protein